MVDKTLKIFIVTMFGIGGLIILLHVWILSATLMDRITMTIFAVLGWVGIGWWHRFGIGASRKKGEEEL